MSTKVELDQEPTVKPSLMEDVYRMLVVVGGAAFLYSSRIPALLMNPEPLLSKPYHLGVGSGAVFVLCTVFLVIWRHVIRRGEAFKHWKMRMRRPVQVLTLSGTITMGSFIVAFWPIYGFLSIPLFLILAYVTLCLLSFV